MVLVSFWLNQIAAVLDVEYGIIAAIVAGLFGYTFIVTSEPLRKHLWSLRGWRKRAAVILATGIITGILGSGAAAFLMWQQDVAAKKKSAKPTDMKPPQEGVTAPPKDVQPTPSRSVSPSLDPPDSAPPKASARPTPSGNSQSSDNDKTSAGVELPVYARIQGIRMQERSDLRGILIVLDGVSIVNRGSRKMAIASELRVKLPKAPGSIIHLSPYTGPMPQELAVELAQTSRLPLVSNLEPGTGQSGFLAFILERATTDEKVWPKLALSEPPVGIELSVIDRLTERERVFSTMELMTGFVSK